jgi:hypothetical protein
MSAMTILSVRGTPVRSGQVRKAVRMSTGRCNPHRATQSSLVCIGIASPLVRNVPAEARARLQRCSRPTSPMIRLLMGICQHRRPVMSRSRGGLCQAAPAAPSTPLPGPYGRMACQPATAGGHSRFVDMIPHVSLRGSLFNKKYQRAGRIPESCLPPNPLLNIFVRLLTGYSPF